MRGCHSACAFRPHGSTKTCRFITRRSLFRRRETAFRRSCARSTRRRTAAALCATTTILSSRPTAPTRTSSIRRSTISDEIECGPRLGEDLLEAEDDSGAFKLLLETEDDLVALEECRYMISRPICLCAENADLLEKGLRVFPGLALYDGTWEQPDEVVRYWERKYGLVRL